MIFVESIFVGSTYLNFQPYTLQSKTNVTRFNLYPITSCALSLVKTLKNTLDAFLNNQTKSVKARFYA